MPLTQPLGSVSGKQNLIIQVEGTNLMQDGLKYKIIIKIFP